MSDYAYVDDPKVLLDLSFLPAGTRFITRRATIDTIPDADASLYVATNDGTQLVSIAESWLQGDHHKLVILWNVLEQVGNASVIARLAQLSQYAQAVEFNETVWIVLAKLAGNGTVPQKEESGEQSAGEHRINASGIEEIVARQRSGTYVPNDLLKQILWRYSYVLRNYGEQIGRLRDELRQTPTFNPSAHDIQVVDAAVRTIKESQLGSAGLRTARPVVARDAKEVEVKQSGELVPASAQLADLEIRYSDLQHKYSALANSRLGRLTLKYWAWRKRGAK
ncbi:MAG: hypothetical protein SPI12_02425 [Actinomycetaceae bacterium]|nr:hypothetical protein [Actinomycetaceae bacterium]MDY6082705.1 hypothetical protein [Actinomycetaceae bacterium]